MRIESKSSGTQATDVNANKRFGSKNLYIGLTIYIINKVENIVNNCVFILNFVVNKNRNKIIVGIIANKQLIGNKKNIISQFRVFNFWIALGMCIIKIAKNPNNEYRKYVKSVIAKKFALKRLGSLSKYSFNAISRL